MTHDTAEAFMKSLGFKQTSPDDWVKGKVLMCRVQAEFIHQTVLQAEAKAREDEVKRIPVKDGIDQCFIALAKYQANRLVELASSTPPKEES